MIIREQLRRVNMNHFATTLSAGFIATVFVSGTAFVPIPAEAATDSGMALKDATVACRAEAKDKMGWFARRRYVNNCVARTVKLTPAEIAKIAVKEATVGCKAEAKGKKIGWLARHKFVNACVTAALKDYSVDVNEVRRKVNVGGLRVYTPEETGCYQNVFC
jgi:hypothetical protein